MPEVDHVAYFRQRAAAERELAAAAPASNIARLHLEMAERYEALCHQPKDFNVLSIVGDSPWSRNRLGATPPLDGSESKASG